MKMTPYFYRMVNSGEQFTVRQWATALECPQYQFNSALVFSALTGVDHSRIKEVVHAFPPPTHPDDSRDGGAVRR